jgi:hypothetical protein
MPRLALLVSIFKQYHIAFEAVSPSTFADFLLVLRESVALYIVLSHPLLVATELPLLV